MAAKLKKTRKCLTDCDKALELDPNYTKAALRRAKCYMETEQYEKAIRDYERILKSDPSNMEYSQLLQEAKRELKKPKSLYEILGVKSDANNDQIKKAYHLKALLHHPDRHSSASEEEKKMHETKFKMVSFSCTVKVSLIVH